MYVDDQAQRIKLIPEIRTLDSLKLTKVDYYEGNFRNLNPNRRLLLAGLYYQC
jgi:hypothetical protein